MTARDQAITIPNADDVCSLDLRLSCEKGDDLLIPFGIVETQTLAQQKSATQKTASVAISPRVFNEASLDKAKASPANFIEHIDNLPSDAASGYIYVFVDGFLWREVACIDKGLMSDVDLMQHHSKDMRPHSAKSASKLLIPLRTKGLYNGNDLAAVVVELAFSRVQWSWQYINDLGGMFPTDKRFAKSPLLSKCGDLTRAASLRAVRCQMLDFTQGDNPSNCEFIEVQGADYVVYLHDVIGIARRYNLLLNDMVTVLDSYYHLNKQKPYYDSALLAYQLYFNEKLHKRVYSVTKHRYELKDTSSQANSLRDIADLLDAKTIEEILICADELAVLAQYLDTRQILLDYLNVTFEKQSLATICQQNKVHPPIEYYVAMRDVSTLSHTNYHQGQTLVYDMLNCATKPMVELPIFIKALSDGSKKFQLNDRMKKLEKLSDAFASELSKNKQSWLRLQFCAHVNAFGTDMQQDTPEEINTQDEPGMFNPEKLSQALATSDDSHATDALLKSIKASSALSVGILTYWKNQLKSSFDSNTAARELSFKIVGPTLKSMGTDVFKHLTFSRFGQIPDGYTIVGNDIVEQTLFQGKRYNKARRALENAIDAISHGQKIAPRDIRLIEKYAPHGTHTSNSEQRGVVVTNRHTGATVGVTTRAGARALIQKGLDTKGFLEDLRTSQIRVLVVPTSAVPQIHAYQLNQDNPLRGQSGLRLDNIGRFSKRFHQSVPGAIFLLDGMLSLFMYSEYEQNFKKSNQAYEYLKNTAVIAELMVSGAQAFEAYVSSQTAISRELAVERVNNYNASLEKFGHSMKITPLTITGGLVTLLGAGIVAWDAWVLLQKRDNDAAAAAAASAGLGIGLGLATMVGLSGPIVWALMLGSVAFGMLSGMLINSDTENWAAFGPFAKDKGKRLKRFTAFSHPHAYYNFISSILMSPSVKIARVQQSNNFVITINTPLYDDLHTDVYIKVTLQERAWMNGRARAVTRSVPINHEYLDSSIRHKIAEPNEIRNAQGRITQLQYHAYFEMKHVDEIKAQASLVLHNIHYPQKLGGYEDIAYTTDDTCYSEDTPVDQVVNQAGWAQDTYKNTFIARIIDDIGALL